MRFPVKINRSGWPELLCRRLPVANDPRVIASRRDDAEAFSRGVCALKFGATFKTTESARYPLMVDALAALALPAPPVILDVGASDGSASLALIERVPFSRYYLTDRNPLVHWRQVGADHFFYDGDRCILRASPRFVHYTDTDGAVWPAGWIARRRLDTAPAFDERACERIELINPSIAALGDERVVVRAHDMFEPWTGERPDVVVAANILNRVYFDDATLARAIDRLLAALDGEGHFAIVDNRPDERGSLFALQGGVPTLLRSINGGAETESLVMTRTEPLARHAS